MKKEAFGVFKINRWGFFRQAWIYQIYGKTEKQTVQGKQ